MELEAHIAQFGAAAYLVTVRPEGRPHVVAVTVACDDGEIVTNAGERTAANVARHRDVTVLWAAPPGSGYCLVLDGAARVLDVDADAGGARRLRVRPARAVLHRTPDGDASSPSCITIL